MIKIDKQDINKIISVINDNQLIILKTDTVYGIMALANKENEIKINNFKQSLENKKISVIFSNVEKLLKNIKNLDEERIELIKEKLPGKYTFIVNLDNFSNFNRIDFGVRVTGYDYLQNIISKTGPLLASSCNLTGYNPCTNLKEIEEQFGDKDIYLVYDGEGSNTPSTIIDIKDNEIRVIR